MSYREEQARRSRPRIQRQDVDYDAMAARLLSPRTRPVVDPDLQPTREVPSMSKLSSSDLATTVAGILIDEITRGASMSPRITTEARQTLTGSLRWMLEGEEPTSYSVTSFPGNAMDDKLARGAAMNEFVNRIQGRRGGDLNG